MPICKSLSVIALSLASVLAFAQQEQPTPYDLIRPVYPLTWDSTIFDKFDTTVTIKKNMVPKNRTPASYAPNAIIPDTLNQAYLDNINLHISPIRVNQAGYLPKDPEKQFYYVGNATTFEVVDIDGKSLSPQITGNLTPSPSGSQTSSDWTIIAGTNAATNDQQRYKVSTTGPSGAIQIGHIPGNVPTDTRLRIRVGSDISSTFIVSERVYSMVRSAALKFYGINRSGDGESWFHPASHMKDGAGPVVTEAEDVRDFKQYNAALEGTLQGGYYDCGDHLKESQTQIFAFMVAAVLAATNPKADEDNYAYNQGETVNTDGIPDMLREAKHGADFVLRAYVRAKGVIDDMALSVGNFGSDHGWWGRPENSDKLPINNSAAATDRGGPASRTVRLGEIGANIGGEAAAGLAILAKDYAIYDKAFADSCLMVAEKMYEFAKSMAQGKVYTNNKQAAGWSSPAYNGNNEFVDDLALASVALLYATGKKEYADDMIRNRNMFQGQEYMDGAGAFAGGWFVTEDKGFLKNAKNTSWANTYAYATYALYKLILQDKEKALNEYGLTEKEWLDAVEDCVMSMILNLGDMGNYGSGIINLPTIPGGQGPAWKPTNVTYDPIWYTMRTDQDWIYNRYQAGNIFEVLAYADVSADIERKGISLPILGTPEWKSDEMYQLGINQLNYMLGVNPWDVSYVLGIGDKNDAHPHHRAANPEGKNMPGAGYKYNPPVGALYGGIVPGATNSMVPTTMSWEDYHKSETCIDAAAILVSGCMLAAQEIDRTRSPKISVEIRHVSMDSAIVMVKLNVRGTAAIYYGTKDNITTMTTIAEPDKNEAGMQHEIILRGLNNGTTYYFFATAINAYSPDSISQKFMVDTVAPPVPYSFTTLAAVESADIQNITVCNLQGDSAEIMWYTPNGEYESKIYWDTIPHTDPNDYAWNSGAGNADVSGIPTKFHYVKIGGLKEQTTYYYAVESNGVYTNVDADGNLLKFTTPVGWYDFSVRAYQYIADGGLDFLDVNIYNNEGRAFDSLTLRLYVTATPEEIEVVPQTSPNGGAEGFCPMMVDSDICQAYDEAGFNQPCENDRELRDNLRGAPPVRLEDTYNATTGTYDYYIPINLGSTVIKSSSRLRFDVRFSQGIHHYGQGCDPLVKRAVKSLSKNSSDWSWRPHKWTEDGADYDGMPVEDKDYGDFDNDVPVNPYIAVYRKDEFIWGYSPSYQEMTTKRAHYQMEVTYDAPFNVSDGSYVEIDQTSSTVYVTGHAYITESGFVTKIWANGQEVHALDAATFNEATGMWDLKIPVKMKIGSNKIDVTVFAGPDPFCSECTTNGGCAFNNRTYYVQFTKGNATQSSLTIKDANGAAVSSPADPKNTSFSIYLVDKDKAGTSTPIYVSVINSKKQDTLKVKMVEDAQNPGTFISGSMISAKEVSKDSRKDNEISFFAGDTIRVIYQDPDDEEDYSSQTFFAESNYPQPQKVIALDTDCDYMADKIQVVFSNSLDDNYAFDSIRVFIEGMADTVTIPITGDVLGKSEVEVSLAGISVPANSTPSGKATVYLRNEGITSGETVKISDGILPDLLSVTILENENHEADTDVVIIAFTEPVYLSSQSVWPLAIGSLDQSSIAIKNVSTDNEGKSWKYIITGNTNGQLIPVGSVARIKDGANIQDQNFNVLNPAASCKQINIMETPAPVPVTLATMIDNEGDGYADQLVMRFKKKLRDKDMLDSFVVDWGSPSIVKSYYPADWEHTFETGSHYEYTYDTVSTSPTYNQKLDSNLVTDSISIITINFTTSNGYPLGATSGAYGGAGRVKPRLGPEGGFFDITYPINDKCPPIIVKATKATQGDLEILTVTFSEELQLIENDMLKYIERKRGSETGVYLIPSRTPSHSGNRGTFAYSDETPTAVRIGDFIRMVPIQEMSRYKDKSGNYPTEQNPWIKVVGSSAEKTKIVIKVAEAVTKINNSVIPYGIYPLQDGEDFRITLVNTNGTETLLQQTDNYLVPSAIVLDPNSYKHGGPVFNIDVIIPSATTTDASGKYVFEFDIALDMNIYDNLGQYINRKKFKIDLNQLGYTAIAEDGAIHLNLEWLAVNGEAPVSENGRKMGSGAYIAKFDFKAVATYTGETSVSENTDELSYKNGEKIKTTDNTTKTFGFKRALRK